MINDETQEVDLETSTEEAEETTETQEEEKGVEYWKAEALKNKAILDRNKEKINETEKKATVHDALDIKDTIYLGKADIHDDDLDEVLYYAKNMKVSVREAHEHYKPILADRNDERRTAQATQTKSPRGITKNSGEDTLRKAESTGEVPESEKEMEAMLQARLERRRQST